MRDFGFVVAFGEKEELWLVAKETLPLPLCPVRCPSCYSGMQQMRQRVPGYKIDVWINNKQKRTINNPYKRCIVYFVSLDTPVFF